MGLFDDIRCQYPLPIEGANGLDYQTKDTPAQYMEMYEIREDGTLWHEEYDVEDHSELALWKAAHPGEEPPPGWEGDMIKAFAGCAARVNKRWNRVADFTGEIRFYGTRGEWSKDWIEWSAYLVRGTVKHLELVENRPASESPNQGLDGNSAKDSA